LQSTDEHPEWFRETGHLSDKGIEHLLSLFEQGKSTYAAAKEMGISYRATSLRHAQWSKRRAKS
jgi:molybdenum-dependent DNA-binding transcriptional regulator ModE